MLTPIGVTLIDWTTYIAAHQQLGMESPTRDVDKHALDTKSPATFLATLGDDAIMSLRTAYQNKRTDFIHLLFLMDHDERVLKAIQDKTRITAIYNGDMVLLTGTLTTYMDAIISCSKLRHPLLKFCNALFVYLDRGGFRECFYDYQRDSIGDAFTLKHR